MATWELPRDRWLLAYWIVLLQGLASAVPWNVYITETEFFALRVHQPPFTRVLADNFETLNLLTSMVGNLIGFLLYVPLHHIMSLDVQVLWPQCLTLSILAASVVLTLKENISGDGVIAIILSSQAVLGLTNATITGGVYAMASWLPATYIQGMSLGIGLGGVAVSGISFITLWAVPRGAGPATPAQVAPAAFAYFLGSAAVVLLAIITYYIFFMLPYVHSHSIPEVLAEWEGPNPSLAPPPANLRRESANFLRMKTRGSSTDLLSASLSRSIPDIERSLLASHCEVGGSPSSSTRGQSPRGELIADTEDCRDSAETIFPRNAGSVLMVDDESPPLSPHTASCLPSASPASADHSFQGTALRGRADSSDPSKSTTDSQPFHLTLAAPHAAAPPTAKLVPGNLVSVGNASSSDVKVALLPRGTEQGMPNRRIAVVGNLAAGSAGLKGLLAGEIATGMSSRGLVHRHSGIRLAWTDGSLVDGLEDEGCVSQPGCSSSAGSLAAAEEVQPLDAGVWGKASGVGSSVVPVLLVKSEDEKADEEERELTLGEVVNKLWGYNLVASVGLVVTMATFPGVTSAICSEYNDARTAPCNPNTPQGRFFGDLFVPFMFLACNGSDLCGRLLAGMGPWAKKPPPMAILVVYSLLRIPLSVPLLFCNIVTPSPWRLPVLFRSDMWPLGIAALLGLTNGHLQSLALMHAPSVLPKSAKDRCGPLINFALAIGVMAGSLLSFGLTYYLQSSSRI